MVDQVLAVTLGQQILDQLGLRRRQLWTVGQDPLVGHQALEQKFEGAAKKKFLSSNTSKTIGKSIANKISNISAFFNST